MCYVGLHTSHVRVELQFSRTLVSGTNTVESVTDMDVKVQVT